MLPVLNCVHKETGKEETTMTRKEIIEQVLARVPEEKKEAFIKELTECKDMAEKTAVLEKFGVSLTA